MGLGPRDQNVVLKLHSVKWNTNISLILRETVTTPSHLIKLWICLRGINYLTECGKLRGMYLPGKWVMARLIIKATNSLTLSSYLMLKWNLYRSLNYRHVSRQCLWVFVEIVSIIQKEGKTTPRYVYVSFTRDY